MKTTAWTMAILSILILTPAQALDQEGPPNLTGKWILNEEMSDDFEEAIKAARGGGAERPPRQGQGGGPGGGGQRGGGNGGGNGGGGSEGRQNQDQKRMEQTLQEFSSLEIFQDGNELNVTDGLDITWLVSTDGREMTIWTRRGEAKATAIWREKTLVLEWNTRQNTVPRIREYTLKEEGRQLVMEETLKLPGQDKSVEITRVYDLVE